jgi:hypothetical protein
VLRHIFERVVWAAMAMGLVKGEDFAVDASVLEANASRYHGKAPEELDWSEKQRQTRAVADFYRQHRSLADILTSPRHVRFIPRSRHSHRRPQCLLSADAVEKLSDTQRAGNNRISACIL